MVIVSLCSSLLRKEHPHYNNIIFKRVEKYLLEKIFYCCRAAVGNDDNDEDDMIKGKLCCYYATTIPFVRFSTKGAFK